ncbi:MAG TPA: hypothetical protein VM936_11340 [Pyrinomonadaceae bacterium]|jgi:hypothetical protein|nr:hypothetical protein [Pyrinomonadaceae bacterium]
MKRLVFPREVLLVEVERRCGEPVCGARVKLSLTKAQARAYTGFECERCGRWYADALAERDIPEWWEELNVASLRGLKPAPESPKPVGEGPNHARESLKPESEGAPKQKSAPRTPPPRGEVSKPAPRVSRAVEDDGDEPEAVLRLSEEWRRLGGERESAPDTADDGRGDSF